MSTVLLPRSFATDPDQAMQRIAPLLGIQEWKRHDTKVQLGGLYCTAQVLGIDVFVHRYDPQEEHGDQYGFFVSFGLGGSRPNTTTIIDGIADSVARRLAGCGIQTATLKVDKNKLPHLMIYPT